MFYFSNNLSFGKVKHRYPSSFLFLCFPLSHFSTFSRCRSYIWAHTVKRKSCIFQLLINSLAIHKTILSNNQNCLIHFLPTYQFSAKWWYNTISQNSWKIVRKPCNQYDWDCLSSSKVPWIENSKGTHTVELKSMILAHTVANSEIST